MCSDYKKMKVITHNYHKDDYKEHEEISLFQTHQNGGQINDFLCKISSGHQPIQLSKNIDRAFPMFGRKYGRPFFIETRNLGCSFH